MDRKRNTRKRLLGKFWQVISPDASAQVQDYFGLEEDNYIGSLQQINARHREWHIFFSECRILPLVKILFDTGAFSKKDLTAAESFCNNPTNGFPPSRLHFCTAIFGAVIT